MNLGFGFLDDWLLPCHIFFDITEECMEPNDYLSPRDTHFLRLMTITIYKGLWDLFLDTKHQEFVIKAYSNVSGYSRNSSKSDIENIRRDFGINIPVIITSTINNWIKYKVKIIY